MVKMNRAGICCEKCFASIARKSTKAAKLWLDLCEMNTDHLNIFYMTQPLTAPINLLELDGFIELNKTPSIVKIKINGKHKDESGVYFCLEKSHE